MPQRTLGELAALVGGRLVGDANVCITGVAAPEAATPEQIVFLLSEAYAQAVAQSAAGAVVTASALELSKPQIVVPHPRRAMAQLMAEFAPALPFSGIDATAVIDPSAVVAPDAAVAALVSIGAGSVVGSGSALYPGVVVGRNVTIGKDCVLYPRVVLYDDTVLGDRVLLHAGCVVGSDGYGFVADTAGKHLKIPQMGNVILGDDVELGANCAVDRATFGSTVIGRGTKVDNLVHIGHNDRIGEDVLIVSQTGISGSVTVGDRVVLAGQVGVAGHLSIGANTMVLARSGVTKDVAANQKVSGFPARPHQDELRRQAAPAEVARLKRELAALRTQVAALAERSERHDA